MKKLKWSSKIQNFNIIEQESMNIEHITNYKMSATGSGAILKFQKTISYNSQESILSENNIKVKFKIITSLK
jgi:hypothetical protein